MTGNVVVDDIQTEEEKPGRRAPVWLLALGAAALVFLFMLSRQPEALPPSPSLTIPEVIVPEDRWERLDLPGSGSLTDLTLLDDGTYVAVGEGPQFWTSTDSTHWTLWPPSDVDPAVAAAVTPFGDGAVAVGTSWLGDLTTRAAIWVATDLKTWESVAPLEEGDSGLEGVVSDGEILIAWGWQGTAQPFSPAGEAVLLLSTDGLAWQEIPAPTLDARVYAVRPRPAGGWWAMGYEIGRPALWFTEDLQNWEAVPSRGLPFGWAMVDLVDPNQERLPLLTTLVDVGDDRIRRWQLEPDGEWVPLGDRPGGPSRITAHHVEQFGTGGGRLWVLGEDHTEREALDVWEPLDLDGEVRAVERRVAVGMAGDWSQPSLWVVDADTVTYSLPSVTGPSWEKVAEFGEGMYVGAWPVGSGWVVGTSATDWWFVDGEGVEAIDPGWTQLWRIDQVGSEWMAIPSMLWSDDGREWETRGELFPSLGDLLAVREDGNGDVVALYRSEGWMWTVARSDDRGRSWKTVSEPTASTPVWSVVPTSTGFVGAAARQRGTEAIVYSPDGIGWEDLEGVDHMLSVFQPAAMSEAGTLILLDTSEEIEVPRQDIVQVARAGEDLVLLAGGRIWVGRDGDWEVFPLDAAHGLASTSAVPIVIDVRVHVVASDGTGVAMYAWRE